MIFIEKMVKTVNFLSYNRNSKQTTKSKCSKYTGTESNMLL